MPDDRSYDLAIVGGGLAGLALSIQVANAGFKVILFEKEKYPFHRVCGEYISLESEDFLQHLGVDLQKMNASKITELFISANNGSSIQQHLLLGGFGISRYKLDNTLAQLAINAGVYLMENTRVEEIRFTNDSFNITSNHATYNAKITVATFGKRSNLDIKWNRDFVKAKKNKHNNYVGIKYHVRGRFPVDTIELHNFKNGYCGLVKVEDNQYCLCYLTVASNLQKSNNDIREMERVILSGNPFLKKILAECEKLRDGPVIISQINFDKKSLVHDHILFIGDAAGMITPLCGNGMSMALHASKLAAGQVVQVLSGKISRDEMENNYSRAWNKEFAGRLRTGRILQRMLDNTRLTSFIIKLGKYFPGIMKRLVRSTHGRSF